MSDRPITGFAKQTDSSFVQIIDTGVRLLILLLEDTKNSTHIQKQ